MSFIRFDGNHSPESQEERFIFSCIIHHQFSIMWIIKDWYSMFEFCKKTSQKHWSLTCQLYYDIGENQISIQNLMLGKFNACHNRIVCQCLTWNLSHGTNIIVNQEKALQETWHLRIYDKIKDIMHTINSCSVSVTQPCVPISGRRLIIPIWL